MVSSVLISSKTLVGVLSHPKLVKYSPKEAILASKLLWWYRYATQLRVCNTDHIYWIRLGGVVASGRLERDFKVGGPHNPNYVQDSFS